MWKSVTLKTFIINLTLHSTFITLSFGVFYNKNLHSKSYIFMRQPAIGCNLFDVERKMMVSERKELNPDFYIHQAKKGSSMGYKSTF